MAVTEKIFLSDSLVFEGPPGQLHEIQLPSGFRRVWRGAVKGSDLYLNLTKLRQGITQWDSVGETVMPYDVAETFGMVVRNDGEESPDKPCEHCGLEVARYRCRFCETCISKGVHRRKAAANV